MSCPVRDPGGERPADWDPLDETVLADQRAAFDALRERCPVARSDAFGWSVLRHADVLRVLHDPTTFSNAVSQHLSVPNGIDPPRHAAWRATIEPYFADDGLASFRPRCRALADRLAGALAGRPDAELMDAFAGPFAAEAQCAFLGWSPDEAEPLREWTRANQRAIRDGDRERLAGLARVFERRVTAILDARRGCAAETDATCRLMHERVEGRSISVRPFSSEPPARGERSQERAPRGPRERDDPNRTLYVGNLPYDVEDQELGDILREKGAPSPQRMHLPADHQTGRKRGFAFVNFATEEEAQTALTALNGLAIRGRSCAVHIAHPKGERPPRQERSGGPPGGGFPGGGGGDFGGGGRFEPPMGPPPAAAPSRKRRSGGGGGDDWDRPEKPERRRRGKGRRGGGRERGGGNHGRYFQYLDDDE